ncbi:hypothetical protein Scep_002585 [Stephania cephalantha]|uniref:Uncharacterized protein n=1 Tax=Stephania cephalantha TaxID=152367 RepID=A0AAP0Q621_9MAGN
MDFRDLVDRGLVSRSLSGWVQESEEVGKQCELCVHDSLDCSTCDPTLGEWRPELALGARVGDSADLANVVRDQVLGQLDATTGGNLVTRRIHNPAVNYTSQSIALRNEDEAEESDDEFTSA